jgi:hypothetical protein
MTVLANDIRSIISHLPRPLPLKCSPNYAIIRIRKLSVRSPTRFHFFNGGCPLEGDRSQSQPA